MLGVARATTKLKSHWVACWYGQSCFRGSWRAGDTYSSNGDVKRSETGSRDLRDVDPADGSPTELEEQGEEEDADESEVSRWGYVLAFDRRVDAHVDTDVEHGHTLGDGGPEERAAATERVGGEDEETETTEHLDDTVDSSGEEFDFIALQAESLEDLSKELEKS